MSTRFVQNYINQLLAEQVGSPDSITPGGTPGGGGGRQVGPGGSGTPSAEDIANQHKTPGDWGADDDYPDEEVDPKTNLPWCLPGGRCRGMDNMPKDIGPGTDEPYIK